MTLTVVDSEQTVRTWARANTTISAVVSDRVFFASPQSYEKSPPSSWLTLLLVGETHEADDLGMQQSLIQIDAWGKTKAQAAAAAIAVQNAVRQLEWGPPATVGSAVIQVASVGQRRWRPDPTVPLARYAVDVQFLIRGTATA